MDKHDGSTALPSLMVIICRTFIGTLISILLIVIDNHTTRFGLTSASANSIFFLSYGINLLCAILCKQNDGKIAWVCGGLTELGVAMAYNMVTVGDFIVSQFSFAKFLSENALFCFWCFWFLVSSIYFCVLTVRLLLWTQDAWEDRCQTKQAERKSRQDYKNSVQRIAKELDAEKRASEKKAELELKKEKLKYRNEKQRAVNETEKYIYEKKNAQRKLVQEKETLIKEIILDKEARIASDGDESNIFNLIPRIDGKWIPWTSVAVAVGLLVLYLIAPIFSNPITAWINSARNFLGVFYHEQSNLSQVAVITSYSVYFIAFAGAIIAAIILLFHVIVSFFLYIVDYFRGTPRRGAEISGFFSTYSTPISILIVAVSFLVAFTNGNIVLPHNQFIPDTQDSAAVQNYSALSNFFQSLLIIVLYMLLLMVAVDVVRLMMSQCLERGSLLRTSMKLTFTLIIGRMMEIILGILIVVDPFGFIETLVNTAKEMFVSVFTSMRQSPDDDEENPGNRVTKTIHRAMNNEIDIVEIEMDKYNHHSIDWKPHNDFKSKSKSKFSSFNDSGWSRRSQ